jgi:hypothetical protein
VRAGARGGELAVACGDRVHDPVVACWPGRTPFPGLVPGGQSDGAGLDRHPGGPGVPEVGDVVARDPGAAVRVELDQALHAQLGGELLLAQAGAARQLAGEDALDPARFAHAADSTTRPG